MCVSRAWWIPVTQTLSSSFSSRVSPSRRRLRTSNSVPNDSFYFFFPAQYLESKRKNESLLKFVDVCWSDSPVCQSLSKFVGAIRQFVNVCRSLSERFASLLKFVEVWRWKFEGSKGGRRDSLTGREIKFQFGKMFSSRDCVSLLDFKF